MFYAYVLRSLTAGRLYKGSTADLQRRLQQHSEGTSFFTRSGGPWELVHSEEFATRAEAMRRERFFKTGKGREELTGILAEPAPVAQLDRVRRGGPPEQ